MGAAQYGRRVSRALLVAAAVLLLSLGWSDLVSSSPRGEVTRVPFPPFALNTLDGSPVGDASLAGHVTVVNVWASWCPPCRAEAPVLRDLAHELDGNGVSFLGVLHQDRVEPARQFADRFRLDYPTVVDGGALAGALGIRAIPMTFVVDGRGRITARHFGPIGEARLRVLIEDAQAIGTVDVQRSGG